MEYEELQFLCAPANSLQRVSNDVCSSLVISLIGQLREQLRRAEHERVQVGCNGRHSFCTVEEVKCQSGRRWVNIGPKE